MCIYPSDCQQVHLGRARPVVTCIFFIVCKIVEKRKIEHIRALFLFGSPIMLLSYRDVLTFGKQTQTIGTYVVTYTVISRSRSQSFSLAIQLCGQSSLAQYDSEILTRKGRPLCESERIVCWVLGSSTELALELTLPTRDTDSTHTCSRVEQVDELQPIIAKSRPMSDGTASHLM